MSSTSVSVADAKRAFDKLGCLKTKSSIGWTYQLVDDSGFVCGVPISIPNGFTTLPTNIAARVRIALGLRDFEAVQLFECTMTRQKFFDIYKRRTKGP
jgi:hypothetical protein